MADIDWGRFLFSFDGRINRAKYWLWVLVCIVVTIILGIIGYFVDSPSVMGIVSLVVQIAIFVSGLAIWTKRLHDRDKSAWWLLLFYIGPATLLMIGALLLIFGGFGGSSEMVTVGSVLCFVGIAIAIWAFVELGCLQGTVGSNQYGLDPLGAAPVPAR